MFIEGSATSFLVTDNVNGFLCPNDVEKYAKRIINILNDKKMYYKVSEGCYNDLYIHWDDLIDDLINDYKKIIDKKLKIYQ